MEALRVYWTQFSDHWRSSNRNEKSLIVASCISATLLLRYVYLKLVRKLRKQPDGPVGIPIFGSFLAMASPGYATYLAQKYGAVSMIYAGFQPVVYLNSIDAINQVFTNKASLNRNQIMGVPLVKPHEYSVGLCPYKYWKTKRKDFQSILTAKLSTTFVNDVQNVSLSEYIFKNIDACIASNQAWNFHSDICYLTFNFMWHSCFGTTLEYNSEEQAQIELFMSHSFNELVLDFVISTLRLNRITPNSVKSWLFPELPKFLDFLESTIYKQLNYDESIWDYNNTKWDEHFREVQQKSKTQSYSAIALYLAHHRFSNTETQRVHGTKYGILLQLTIFIFAGIDSTKHTTEYGLVLLAKNPAIQEQIYAELVSVYGRNDKMMGKQKFQEAIQRLHYLRAFVMEVLRISSVANTGLPHYSMDEIAVGDCVIPKDCLIFANLKHSNTRDAYWMNTAALNKDKTEANVCDVDLWLDEKKEFKATLHRNKMVAFSVGDRDCAGKHLALRSLHLLFAKLVMNYKLALPEECRDQEITQKENVVLVLDPVVPLVMRKRK